VGKDQRIHTVQQALQFAHNGDTILVYPGIYKEKNIIVRKPVYLKGIGLPELDGEKKFEIFHVEVSNVTIEGFKLMRSGVSDVYEMAAIKVANARNVVIKNNVLENNFFGIYVQYSSRCVVAGNNIRSAQKVSYETGNAIHCFKCDSMMIAANYITGHRDGIYFEFVTHSLIRQNTSEKNIRYGLHFMSSHFNTYIANAFRNNGAGVAVMYTHDIRMINNVFEMNTGEASYGLLLKEITDSYIQGNKFNKNTAAIYMERANRVRVNGNSFKNNGWAMRIEASCSDDVITNNNFSGNSFDVSTNGSLVLNTFNKNYWDKYDGYDLNRDGSGDVPFRPVSLYSMILEKNPAASILMRSIMVSLLDKAEKIFPSLIPEDLIDNSPLMKPLPL
jgi:nitrous oxidase accessory protein